MKIKARRQKLSLALSALVLVLTLLAGGLAADPPPRTSSFYGSVTVDGGGVPVGTEVTAAIAGVDFVTTTVFDGPEGASFRIDVPGDRLSTSDIEGGVDGQTIAFRVGSGNAPQTAVFVGSSYSRLDLTAQVGADLVVTVDDGVTTVERGETLAYTITISNDTTHDASGVELVATLPMSVESVVASEGGVVDGGTVTWPDFALSAGASTTRSVTLRVRPATPLGVTQLTFSASVSDDGIGGLDPDLSNNTAGDTDTLSTPVGALPNLAIGIDNIEVLPERPQAGDEAIVTVTVRNAGMGDAGPVPVRVWAGDPALGAPVVADQVFDGIPAGGNRQLSFPWTAVEGIGEIVAEADPDETLLEDGRDDNRALREILVPRAAGPDLAVTTADLSALSQSPTTLALSGSVTLTVRNLGDSDATGAMVLRLYEDLGGDGRRDARDPVLGESPVAGPIAAGATASVSVDPVGSTAFLHPLVLAEIDADDVVAEQREDNNTLAIFGDCEILPPPNPSFVPRTEWHATDLDVQVTPTVTQLSDDNGDGLIDGRDTPDAVVLANDGTGRRTDRGVFALSGLDGSRLWTVRSTSAAPLPFPAGHVAAGDLDGDGVAEVVVPLANGRLLGLGHDGTQRFLSDVVEGVGERFVGSLSIGDLSGDGVPEIVVGRTVLSNSGVSIDRGTGNRGRNFNRYGPLGTVLPPGVGDFPHSVIADIDLDGRNELVAGNTVYRLEGGDLTILWNASVPDQLMEDGFAAVGNLDGDPEAEIVYVSSGQIITYHHNGAVHAGRRVITPFIPFQMPTYWGGPPTLADLDGDGISEILVATATELVALRSNLGTMWRRAIDPDFGSMSGVTAFDLDGDGDREVLFRDQQDFFVLNGLDGGVLRRIDSFSKTGTEHPSVADIDGDGRAEVLVPSNTSFSGDGSTRGLQVFGHPGWQGTRGAWNQYAYQQGNVLLDGTVPSPHPPNWLTPGDTPPGRGDGSFRANRRLAPPRDFLPNLTVSLPRVGAAAVEGIPITLRLGNGSRSPVGPGYSLRLYAGDPTAGDVAAELLDGPGIRAGGYRDVTLLWQRSTPGNLPVTVVIDDGGDVAECDEGDNRLDFVLATPLLSDLAVASIAAPASATLGQLVPISVTVENLGLATSDASLLRLYRGTSSAGPLLAEAAIPSISAGDSVVVEAVWDSRGEAPGPTGLYLELDPTGALLELDEGNNSGAASVELVAPAAPDLAADGLRSDPVGPVVEGTVVQLVATVTNRGSDLAAGAEVAYTVNTVEIGRLPVPALLAGESVEIALPFDTLGRSGTLDLAAILDPAAQVAELDEANNRATTSLALEGATVALSLVSDRFGYAANEDVSLDLVASNAQDAADFLLRVRVVDAPGNTLALLAEETVNLASGDTPFAYVWNTGTTPPGPVAVVAELFDAGERRALAVANLSIAPDLRAVATLFSNQDIYQATDLAEFMAGITNQSANATFEDLSASLTVRDAGDAMRFEDSKALPPFAPGDTVPFESQWPVETAPPGPYRAVLEVRTPSGFLVAFAETAFTVGDSAQTGAGLVGELAVSPLVLGAGAPLLEDWAVTNGGNNAMPDLDLRFELVRLSDGGVVASQTLDQPLDLAEVADGSLAFSTVGLEAGDYLARMLGSLPGAEICLDHQLFAVVPGVSVADAETPEGDGGTSALDFVVRLSEPLADPVTVDYATADATAVAGSDYQATSGTLSFAVGEVEKTVTVTVFGDLDEESREIFLLELTDPVGVVLGDAQALGTILDEEGCASPELLVNGDAETLGVDFSAGDPAAGFQIVQGDWDLRFADPPPLSGLASFAARGSGPGVVSELEQTVDLGPYAGTIDAGGQDFLVSGFVRSAEAVDPDFGRLVAEYLDGSGLVLDTFDSGDLAGTSWQAVADRRTAPVGTRALRLRLSASDVAGSGGAGDGVLQVFFDRFEVTSLGTVTLVVGDAEVLEGAVGANTPVAVSLSLACAQPEDVAVGFATRDLVGEGATAGVDYLAAGGTVVIPAGALTATIDLTVLGDGLDEIDETFALDLTAPATIAALDATSEVVIRDDDGPVSVSIDDPNATEGDPGAAVGTTFTVTLSQVSGKPVRVAYQTVAGSAAAGEDYQATVGTVTLAPGTASTTIEVPLVGDRLHEGDEDFELRLSNPQNAVLGDDRGTATIFENDVVTVAVSDVTVLEGDPDAQGASSAVASFLVSLSLPSVFPVSIDVATAASSSGSDAVVGEDYLDTSANLSFAPGATELGFDVPLVSDLVREPLETFLVLLSNPVGTQLGDPEGVASVIDDDGILIAIADAVVREDDAGAAEAVLAVTLSKAALADVEVDFTTRPGEAVAGADYLATAGTLVFPVGTTLLEIRVPLVGDDDREDVEHFFVDLSNPVEGLLQDGEAEVTVVDDDSWNLVFQADDLAIPGCWVVTPDLTNQRGAVWHQDFLDLSQSFDKTFLFNMGSRDASGGEGMYFVLQQVSATTIGGPGGGQGYSGISPSFGVEVDTDTFLDPEKTDHISLGRNGGEHTGADPVAAIPGEIDIEDGLDHPLRMIWNAASQVLDVHFDGNERHFHARDLVGGTFGGDPLVYWGVTGATGSVRNQQVVCPTAQCFGSDTDIAQISVGDVRLTEGDSGSKTAFVPVTLSCPVDHGVEVDFATVVPDAADLTNLVGAASPGSDYQATSQRLVFQPGETAIEVPVEIFGDDLGEPDELILATLSNPVGGVLRYDRGEITIRTDDVGIRILDTSLFEGDVRFYNGRARVELDSPVSSTVRVNYRLVSGTAGVGSDIQNFNGRLTFGAGSTAQSIRLRTVEDTIEEPTEHFTIELYNATGVGKITDGEATVTIFDDDACPSPNLLVNHSGDLSTSGGVPPSGWTEVSGTTWARRTGSPNPFEGAGYFYAGNSAGLAELAQDVDVSSFAQTIDSGLQRFQFLGNVRTRNENPRDHSRIVVEYRDATGAVLATFDSGEFFRTDFWIQTGEIRFVPVGTRSIRVRLIASRGAASGNNDGYFDELLLRALDRPTLSIADLSVVEGDLGESDAVLTVFLSCPAVAPVSVDFVTSDGTARAGSDYLATAGTVVFQTGEQQATLAVPVLGDPDVEDSETFFVNLANPQGAGIFDPQATVTIEADEASLSIADTSVIEGSPGGGATAVFTLTLSRPLSLEVTVDATTRDGSGSLAARQPGDYTATSGTVVFAPGETTATFAVPVVGDLLTERDERFFVDLSNATRAGIEIASAFASILDDDLGVSVADGTALENGGEVVFQVTLSETSALPVTVTWETEDITATAGVDYQASGGTVTLPAGETTATLRVPIFDDTEVESSESFFVRLTSATNAGLLVAEAVGTLSDDDDAPGPNLVSNPGADDPPIGGDIADWEESGGSWDSEEPDTGVIDGTSCFGAQGSSDTLSQEIDLTPFASFIDRGIQRFAFEGYVRTEPVTSTGTQQILLDYRDATGTVLFTFDSGRINSPGVWQQVADLTTVPVGTRSARIRMIGRGNDASCIDGLALRPLSTPVAELIDGVSFEGDPGGPVREVTLTLRLTTPAENLVAADVSLFDASALVGSDYIATSGRFEIPAGDLEATVTVPLVADTLLELEESFGVVLSNTTPTSAAFVDLEGLGTIRDDDVGADNVTREIRTFWLGDLRIYAWQGDTKITLIDVASDQPLDLTSSKITSTNVLTNPFVLERAGDSFEGIGADVRVRILAEDASGQDQVKPITVWTGSLQFRHPTSPQLRDPWMSYLPAFSILPRQNGREIGRQFLGLVYQEAVLLAQKGSEPTRIVIEDLLTNTDGDNDDQHVLTPADAVYSDAEIEIYRVSGFEDDTVRISANTELSVLAGMNSEGNNDWTATPPSYRAGDDASELGTLFYTFVHRSLTIFPVEDDTTVTVSDLSDGDDSRTIHFANGDLDGPYDLFTSVLGTQNGGVIRARTGVVDVNLISDDEPFDNDYVKIESDKPVLVYVGPAGSDVEEFADVAFSVPTGPESRVIYAYAQNGGENDLQIFGFDPDTEVRITSLTTTTNFMGNDHHDFVIGPGLGGANGWLEGTAAGDVWWESDVWGGEILRIESTKPILVINGDYDDPHFGAFMPFVLDTDDLPPIADAGPDLAGFTAEVLTLDGSGSFDQDQLFGGLAERWEWDFDLAVDSDGDGDPTNDIDGVGPTPSHSYRVPGTYTVALTFFDDEGESDSDIAVVTVAAHPLVLTKSADVAGARPGEVVTYTLDLTNTGGVDLTGVALTDPLPDHTTLVSPVTTTAGTVSEGDPTVVTIGDLAAGASVTVTLAVAIDRPFPLDVDRIDNQATASSVELPPVPSDDPATAEPFDPTVTPIELLPALTVLKTDTLVDDVAGDGQLSPGDRLRYTLTIANVGDGRLSSVVLSDPVPANTVLDPASVLTSIGSVTGSAPITLDLGDLLPTVAGGATAIVTFDVTVVDSLPAGVEQVANQAVVSSVELADVVSDDPDTPVVGDPTVTPVVAVDDRTTTCEPIPFDGPGWLLAELGDADQGAFALSGLESEYLQLTGDGTSLYHSGDNGVFYHREVAATADFRLEVDVTGFPVDDGGQVRKTSLMVRTGLDAFDPRVMVTYVPHMPGATPSDPTTTALQFDARLNPGDGGVEIGNTVFEVPIAGRSTPVRLAIEKRGDVLTTLYSIDGGATWTIPSDATFHGMAEIATGESVLAGVMVASYDPSITLTAEHGNFTECRPNGDPPFDPPAPPVCDPAQSVDAIVLLDTSGSMTSSMAGAGSKLEAAQAAIDRLAVELGSKPGSRMALVVVRGHRTPAENLADAYEVLAPLTTNLGAVASLAAAIDPSTIDPGTPTPTALALRGLIDTVVPTLDPAHQPAVVWLSDGIANIDIEGRGPEPYELEEIQAIDLRDAAGDFLSWGAVGWSGAFNGSTGTFDGEPLANAMLQLERLDTQAPDLLVYGLALEGDGVDLGTFNPGLLEYAAHTSGGRAFGASDLTGLLSAVAALATDLDCGGVGTAVLAGRLWHDRDGDGIEGADTTATGEPGLAGVVVDLFDGSGLGLTTGVTDAAGAFVFDGLPAGTYTLQVDATTLPIGDGGLPIDVATFDVDGIATIDTATVTVANGELRSDVDFGYQERPPTELCDLDTFDGPALDPAWQLAEIGDADQGSAAVVDGTLHLTSDGTSLFHGTDNGTFVYRGESGDFRATLRLVGVPDDVGGPARKVCLVARAGLGDSDPRVMVCHLPHLPGANTQALQFDVRRENGTAEEFADLVINAVLPLRVALVREGGIYRVEYSLDNGLSWIQPGGLLGGEVGLDLGAAPLLGVMAASYDPDLTTTFAVDEMEVCRPNETP